MEKLLPKVDMKKSFALPSFDEASFRKTRIYKNFEENLKIYNTYPDDEMNNGVLAYWKNFGVLKELFDDDTNGGLGKYSVFTPIDMDKSQKYALIYNSHGGMDPINKTETFGFAKLAGYEKIICVCPWNGGQSNDSVNSEFPRIINNLLKAGYPVDERRIYAVGFSAGADATGILASAFPDVLAAVSPNPGGNVFVKGKLYQNSNNYTKNRNIRLPVICIGGTMDGGDKYPFEKETDYQNFNIWMDIIAKVKNYSPITFEHSIELSTSSDNEVKRIFGLDFHKTFITEIEGSRWFCGDFYGDDTVVARFINVEGLPHIPSSFHASVAWDFLKHFSRELISKESVYSPISIGGEYAPCERTGKI
jgi:hypothetical protein